MTSPTLGMPNGLNMAQLAQLNGMNGMNPFNMNTLGMASLSAMGISPEAQLLVAQIAAAGGGFEQPGLRLGGGLGGFAGLQQQHHCSIGNGLRSCRSGGRSPGLSSANGKGGLAGGGNGSNSGKNDEEDFDPVVLNDVAGWLRTLRLHKYTPNFEGMTWKEMVMMDQQALEAEGVAALGARRKMLKTFEVVRRKMGMMIPMCSRHCSPRRRRRVVGHHLLPLDRHSTLSSVGMCGGLPWAFQRRKKHFFRIKAVAVVTVLPTYTFIRTWPASLFSLSLRRISFLCI
jgi:hypothetical protein